MVQPQFGKTRRPVVGLVHFGPCFAGLRTVRPTVGWCGVRLKATEGVAVDRQRGNVVSKVKLTQSETVEGERMN